MIREKAYDKAHVGDWVIVHSMDCQGYVEKELIQEGYYTVRCFVPEVGGGILMDLKYPDDFSYGPKPKYSFCCKMCGEKYYTHIDPSNYDYICDTCKPKKIDDYGMDREEEKTHGLSTFNGIVAQGV